jgi:hypothetical protein
MCVTDFLGFDVVRRGNYDEAVEEGSVLCESVSQNISVVNAYLNGCARD